MIRGKLPTETMSQYLLSRIEMSPRISILTETEIESLDGRSRLEEVTWENRRDGSKTAKQIDSVFVMIGAQPNTSWLKGVVDLYEKGFVRTGGSGAFDNTPYATNRPGIYAVGDVRTASIKRVASAVGEGSAAISDMHRYLALHQDVLANHSYSSAIQPSQVPIQRRRKQFFFAYSAVVSLQIDPGCPAHAGLVMGNALATSISNPIR